MPAEAASLLVGGGRDDPSIVRLVDAAQGAGVDVVAVLVDEAGEPLLTWELASGELVIDGIVRRPAGVFLRYDVFTPRSPRSGLDRGLGWYNAVLGWATARRDVRLVNREISPQAGVKPYQLTLARSLGMDVPETWIGNDLSVLAGRAGGDAIAKPVGGGAYVQSLADALAGQPVGAISAPVPAIVQERLEYPEYRVFVVGPDTHVFRIRSERLDYRPDPGTTLDYLGPRGPIGRAVEGCRAVAAALRCDFAACDLKTRDGGSPVFLEINTGPMFAAFDRTADGAVTKSLIAMLVDQEGA